MNTSTKNALVVVGTYLGEFVIGMALGVVLGDVAKRSSKFEKACLIIGGTLGAVALGRTFTKEAIELSNDYLGTNIDVI